MNRRRKRSLMSRCVWLHGVRCPRIAAFERVLGLGHLARSSRGRGAGLWQGALECAPPARPAPPRTPPPCAAPTGNGGYRLIRWSRLSARHVGKIHLSLKRLKRLQGMGVIGRFVWPALGQGVPVRAPFSRPALPRTPPLSAAPVQGYLTCKKTPPPRTLQ